MRRILLVMSLLVMFTLGACSISNINATAPSDYSSNVDGQIYTIVDKVTGVNYIVVECYQQAVSMTPRLTADGKLYITR